MIFRLMIINQNVFSTDWIFIFLLLSVSYHYNFRCHFAQDHWEDHQAIKQTQYNDTQVHSEIVESKECAFSKGQDQDTGEFSETDTNEDWRNSMLQSIL